MGHKLRVEVPGGIFHVTSRGNAQAEVFRDALDYLTFLRCALALFGSTDGFRRFVIGGVDDCNLVSTRLQSHG